MCSLLGSFWCIARKARANFLIRAVRPEAVEEFAMNHDRDLWWCLGQILGTDLEQCEGGMRDVVTPLVVGRFGGSEVLHALGIPMVGARHPEVASLLVRHLEGNPDPPSLAAAEHAARGNVRDSGLRTSFLAFTLVCARPRTHSNQARSDEVGSTKPRHAQKSPSGMCCSPGCLTAPKLRRGPKVGQRDWR